MVNEEPRDEISLWSGEFFKSGFNCAESVLSAVADHYGIESNLIPRIATGFGAAMGCSSGLCGALSGGIMALGMLLGRTTPDQVDAKKRTYESAKRLVQTFELKFSTRYCTEILGFDLADDPEFKRFEAEDLENRKCLPIVERTAAIVQQIIDEKA
jgi:C_GCAxxG_C_C family probable redox protein